jgi:glycosyltransferase involved in cell wall biosynthesis
MPENPLVSVVIPCYNGARFLRAAIDSALGQDYDVLEVVVVDDGSTDETAQVLGEYGDTIIAVRRENGGLSAARNTGIERANGELILLLDADDILLPTCASSRVVLARRDPGVGLVTGVTRYMDENGSLISDAVDMKPAYKDGVVSYVDAMRRFPGPPTGWMIPKRVFTAVGLFDTDQKIAEDLEWCLRALAKYKCLCDPEPRVLYREVPGSLSRNYARNYDYVKRAVKKNRRNAPVKLLTFWWNSRVLYLNSVAGAMTRITKERGPRAATKFLFQRPSAMPYAFVWAGRALWNRFLYVFKTGPLRDKELAIKRGFVE